MLRSRWRGGRRGGGRGARAGFGGTFWGFANVGTLEVIISVPAVVDSLGLIGSVVDANEDVDIFYGVMVKLRRGARNACSRDSLYS